MPRPHQRQQPIIAVRAGCPSLDTLELGDRGDGGIARRWTLRAGLAALALAAALAGAGGLPLG